FFIFSTSLPPTVIYTLSLHDALPIWVHDEAALHRGARAQPRVAALELLHDEPVGDVAEPGAAVALEGGAEDAQLAELGDQRDRKRAGAMMLGDDRDELRLDPVAHGVADHPLVLGQERFDAVVVHAPELLHGRPLYSRTGLEPHGIEVRVVIVRVHALARLQPGDGGVGERRGRRLVEDL